MANTTDHPTGKKASENRNLGLATIGFCYSLGAIGASCHHLFKAFCNSPNAQGVISGIQSVLTNAPRNAGSFAFWAGGVFSAVEKTVMFLRRNNDPLDGWNALIAATVTGMLHDLHRLRRGLYHALLFGLHCGTILCFAGALYLYMPGMEKLVKLEQQLTSGQIKSFIQPAVEHTDEWLESLFGGASKQE